MPELPEVETVRKGLVDRLANFKIHKIEVCRAATISSPGGPEKFIEMMKGSRVGSWERRGKYLISTLHKEEFSQRSNQSVAHRSNGWWGVHLRMTGYFQWHENICLPCAHTRVRFWNKQGKELRFVDIRSFGQMWWVPPNTKPEEIITGLKKLGPEPFSEGFNPPYLQNKLNGRKRSIKAALLDQSLVAGVGNIYADESLFAAKISPQKASGSLNKSEIKRLYESLVYILKYSIGKGGTTFSDFRDLEGSHGNYGGQAWVYRRGGKPCRECGKPIYKDTICGRSTHWCPECQQ